MLRRLLQRVPTRVRHPLMRQLFKFDPDRCEHVEVRFARTAEEYQQAFQTVYEAYAAVGFFESGNNPAARAARALFYPQVALSTSTVVVALVGGRVVGTASLIRDSAMGLAADSLLGASKTRITGQGERVAELSMLAIAPTHRRGGEVLFTLLRYVAMLSMERERLDLAVCTTNVSLADALAGLMLFHPITKPFLHPKSGASTQGLYLDYRDIEVRARRIYRGAPRQRDLPRFFFDEGRTRVRFPDTPWPTTLLPKLGPTEFVRAFGSPAALHENLAPRQLLVLRNGFSPAMRSALAAWLPSGPEADRAPRYDALLDGTGATPTAGPAPFAVRIEQVSSGGALIASDTPLRPGDTITLTAAFGAGRSAELRGRVVHARAGRLYGIALQATDATWTDYLTFLESWLWHSPAHAG